MSPRFALITIVPILAFSPAAPAQDWPRFRGPDGSGATKARRLPTEWSDDKNLVWKTALPGPGASSAIVVGDKVFVASYSGYGLSESDAGDRGDLRLNVICVDKRSGKVVWHESAAADEKVKSFGGFIALHGYASSTPASDGKAVYAFFGPNGVFAYDLQG